MTNSSQRVAEKHVSLAPGAKTGRLPSLDGLRGISIILVLLAHLSGTRGFIKINSWVGDFSHLGVVVFFVISGFLITRLMLAEYAKRGHVSLGHFYARRALRLFPASYTFVLCLMLLWGARAIQLKPTDIWHAVTYTVNYLPNRSWSVGHLWSLSIEEQFYLIWPFAFVMLKPRRAGWAAAIVILVGPVARIANWIFLRHTPFYDLEMFPTVSDSLAMGCLLAMVGGWLEKQTWYLKLFHPVYSFAMVALILLINRDLGYTVVAVFGTSVINLCLAVLIHRSEYLSSDWVGRVLNWKPLAFVGVLSYSLYLWQQLFINRNSHAWINAFPQNLIAAIAVALASYFLLEKPFLRLRRSLRAQKPLRPSADLILNLAGPSQ